MWALSPDTIRDIRALDLVRVLGSQRNADELLRLLAVIESTDFKKLDPGWTARGRITSYSPGQRGPGADWVYYNPWARRTASPAEVRAYCSSDDRAIPDGHPRGWYQEVVPDGWGFDSTENDEDDGSATGGWAGDVPHHAMGDANNDGDVGWIGGGAPVAAINAANAGAAASSSSNSEVAVVRRFLRDVGDVPDSILDNGTWAGFFGYTQGCFG